MGVPEVIYCYYSGDEVHDAFVIENLVDSGKINLCYKLHLKMYRIGHPNKQTK